jgi:TolB-like protein/tetratricopeptide (TPR) repeat protein
VTDFRFGRFELDSRTRELRKDGVRLRLQDQPFAVLAVMLEHPGELLTRDELRDRLWPNGTFVDFEHGLNAAVKRLRSVLGDNAERPRFVETLHRRGYRFIARVERVNGAGGAQLAEPVGGKQRLAVLPFSHLGETNVPGSFASGLTEELMTQLGRLCADRLGVIARSSSYRVQRTDRTVREIGDALRAHYLVEGTVRTEGDRVRITAQLIEVRGERLWADSFRRPTADNRSSSPTWPHRSSARSPWSSFPTAPRRRPRARGKSTYQNYLKGRYAGSWPGDEGIRECLAFYSWLSSSIQVWNGARRWRAHGRRLPPPRTARGADAAETSAARAGSIRPTRGPRRSRSPPVPRLGLGRRREVYRRALSFNPSNEAARRLYGLLLGARRQFDAAVAMTDRALELDPLCLTAGTSAAWVRYVAGDYDDVIERCRHTIDMDPAYLAPHRLLAAARLQAGDVNGCIQHLDSLPAARTDPVALAWLAHALGVKGDRDRAVNILCHLDELAQDRYVSSYHRALAHAGLGDLDATFTRRARAGERDPAIMHLVSEPRFDTVRQTPLRRRYQAAGADDHGATAHA